MFISCFFSIDSSVQLREEDEARSYVAQVRPENLEKNIDEIVEGVGTLDTHEPLDRIV